MDSEDIVRFSFLTWHKNLLFYYFNGTIEINSLSNNYLIALILRQVLTIERNRF